MLPSGPHIHMYFTNHINKHTLYLLFDDTILTMVSIFLFIGLTPSFVTQKLKYFVYV